MRDKLEAAVQRIPGCVVGIGSKSANIMRFYYDKGISGYVNILLPLEDGTLPGPNSQTVLKSGAYNPMVFEVDDSGYHEMTCEGHQPYSDTHKILEPGTYKLKLLSHEHANPIKQDLSKLFSLDGELTIFANGGEARNSWRFHG
jgi:hypothetical protein